MSILPVTTAATPIAAAPSTISRSSRTIAAMAEGFLLFGDDGNLLHQVANQREGRACRDPCSPLRPSAIVVADVDGDDLPGGEALGERGSRLRLPAPTVRAAAVAAIRNPADQPPASDGTTNGVDLGSLVEDLERDRAGARDDVRCEYGEMKRASPCAAYALALRSASS